MSVGEDIKEVYQEIGASITILRDSGNITGEYVDLEENSQVTKPFIREFFLEAGFQHDSVGVVGDVVTLDTIAAQYMVMNWTPDLFENAVIENRAVLYKCNVSGEILRPSGEEVWGDMYHKTTQFESIRTNCYALQTEPLFGNLLNTDEELGAINIERDELYIPSRFGIQVNDRYSPASGEYYRVESVLKRRFPGVDVCRLGEDTR